MGIGCSAGVGAGGLVELRAQLYRTQEHARLVREGDAERPVRRKVSPTLMQLRHEQNAPAFLMSPMLGPRGLLWISP